MRDVFETLSWASGVTLAAVLNSLWLAVALALAVWVVLKLTPRINAATRYVVWWAVLIVVLVLPMAPQLTFRQAKPASAVAEPILSGESEVPPLLDHLIAITTATPARGPLLPFEFRLGAWLPWMAAVWSAVFLIQLGQICWSYRYLRGIKRRCRPAAWKQRLNFSEWLMACRVRRPVRLLVSSEIVSPIAVGFRHPAVILPEPLLNEFTEPELDHVLLHELAHIARRDDWMNLVARLGAAALALHPVAAWLLRRIEREREIACDDWVVEVTGSARPYAASLARLFDLCRARRRELLAPRMAGSASHLGERIESLLRRRPDFAPPTLMARVALGAIVLLAFVIASAQMPPWIVFAQEPAPPAPPSSQAAQPEPRPSRPRAIFAAPPPMQLRAAPRAVAAGSRRSLLAELVASGYGDLSVDEIIKLKNNSVSADFISEINQAGWGKLTTRQLIDLRLHSVTPEYVRRMREAGLKDLAFRDVIDARINSVRPEHLQEIHAMGFGPYTTRQAIEFANHGVRPDLFRALKDAGFADADPGEIIEARNHGLRAENLHEAKTYGSKLTLKQIIRLKQAGVI